MAPHVAGLQARGIEARAVDLPKGRAERAIPIFARLLASEPGVALGGHSFGGRVASFAAADACDAGRPPVALVLLSYPLHPPGRPDDWDARTAHWPRITCPVIVLSGTSDPFATPALLARALAERCRSGVVTYPRSAHAARSSRRAGPGRGVRLAAAASDRPKGSRRGCPMRGHDDVWDAGLKQPVR
jgi:predicted alpha/beta-hydrolase family hydrolase